MTRALDPRSTWTIKSMGVEARERAARAALDAGMTVGEWMEQAIDRMIEGRPLARSPSEGAPGPLALSRILIPVDPAEPSHAPLVAVLRVIQAAGAMASVTGKPVPRGLSRAVYARLLAQVLENSG